MVYAERVFNHVIFVCGVLSLLLHITSRIGYLSAKESYVLLLRSTFDDSNLSAIGSLDETKQEVLCNFKEYETNFCRNV